jgi:hypothetical protein
MYCPTLVTGEVTVGSATVMLSNMTGVVINQAVFGTGIPVGATVKGVDASMQTVLLSQQATVGGAATPLSFYSYGMPYVNTVGNVAYICSGAGWLQGGGGGGGIPYPTGTGIPQVNGGVGWGASYNAVNQIPASYLNLSAYITSVTAAATYQPLLGYTPYNSTNPAGYVTASALTPYLQSSTAAALYAPIFTLTTNGSGAATYIANVLNIPASGSGIDGVPFCTGFTPVAGQTVTFSTTGTPNPCWAAAGGINLYVNGTLVASGLTGVSVNGH